MDPVDFLVPRLTIWIPLVLSLSVHEWAHAWAAWRLGDDTAALAGRMTFNPLAHIDPVGTVLLPLLGVPFGWAKPVPVNPLRFRSGVSLRGGMMLTAAAGPLSNLVLAVLCTMLFALLLRFGAGLGPQVSACYSLLQMMMLLNVILATFNLLPIPPLDGSRIADYLMPGALRPAWESYQQLGPLALLAVIFLPMLGGFSLVEWPVRVLERFLGLLVNVLGG